MTVLWRSVSLFPLSGALMGPGVSGPIRWEVESVRVKQRTGW